MKLILVLIVLMQPLFSQEKCLIYFKDKGIDKNKLLQKNSYEYKTAMQSLPEKCISRRIKNLGEENFISFEDYPLNENYLIQLKKIGIGIIHKLKWFNAVSVMMNENQKKIVAQFPFVDKIEKIKKLSFKNEALEQKNSYSKKNKSTTSTLTNYGFSYSQLALSDIPQVHIEGITGKNILIGILDTGFDWKRHDALKYSKVLSEYDFIFKDSITANQSEDAQSQDSHGTYVFSIIGGYKDSSLIGSAFGADFLLAKTEDVRKETHIEEDNYAAALEWMENLGADIITSSLGYNTFDSSYSYTYQNMDGKTTIVTKATELAFKKGVVVLTAAGNEGSGSWKYIIAPADGNNTIAVGAVNNENSVASFSSIGPTFDGRTKPEIVAMGVSVFGASAHSTNNYIFQSGTSAATPIAAGVAGLLLSAYPYLKNFQVRNILLETSDNSSVPNNQRGYGLISALKSISFPNISFFQDIYRINKYFFNKINPSSVKINYSLDGIIFNQLNMSNTSGKQYSAIFPDQKTGQMINFFITYNDSLNNEIREPHQNTYYFFFGDFSIYSNAGSFPTSYELKQNYPNPFNSSTKIELYSITEKFIELNIYNAIGEKVKTLYSGLMNRGLNIFYWDGRNGKGTLLSSGVYFCNLKIDDKTFTKKMILLR